MSGANVKPLPGKSLVRVKSWNLRYLIATVLLIEVLGPNKNLLRKFFGSPRFTATENSAARQLLRLDCQYITNGGQDDLC